MPTLVAIGHERDVSLAELAADCRASTPSNAAELLVPDKKDELRRLHAKRQAIADTLHQQVRSEQQRLRQLRTSFPETVKVSLAHARREVLRRQQLLLAFSPEAILQRGYAIVRSGPTVITMARQLQPRREITLQFQDGMAGAKVTSARASKKLQ